MTWRITRQRYSHPMSTTQEIFFVTGEPSGDLHAALLAQQLAQWPQLQLTGAGGPLMRQAGVVTDFGSSEWGTVGIAGALRRVPYLLLQKYRIAQLIARRQPALVILVDFGAFNVRLARTLRRYCPGQRILYYFPPSSWSRQRRDWSFLAELTDVVITPFEWSAQNLRDRGVNVHWTGHPVLDRISPPADRAAFRRKHALPDGQPVVGLMPGSRSVERRCIGPQLLSATTLINNKLPDSRFLWSIWPPGKPGRLDHQADQADYITCLSDSRTLIMACDMVVAASGTAALEAAAADCPMIMVYRGTRAMVVQYWLSDFGTEYYAMPNIIAQRRVIPELLQWDVNPDRVACEVVDLYTNPARWDQMKRDLAEVREVLGPPGASRRAAQVVAEVLGLPGNSEHSRAPSLQPTEDKI